MVGKFAQSAAALNFGFPERLNGSPNVFGFDAYGRKLTINSISRVVQFVTTRDGRTRWFMGRFELTTDGHHDVFLAWDDDAHVVRAFLDGTQMEEVSGG